MQKFALGSVALSLSLVAGAALAQNTEGEDAAQPEAADAARAADEEEEEDEREAKPAASAGVEVEPKAATATADTEASPAAGGSLGGVDDQTGTPRRPPVFGKRDEWSITPYGYARFDAIADSTQSFEDGINPNLIARAGSYRGDHMRSNFTARDSRIGLFVGAPNFNGLRSYAQLELDFFGLVPTDARRHDSVVFGPLRIRHAFFKLETSVVDVLAGQYWDVFGWGSQFFPATAAFLGVPGQVYHRNPQLRLERAFDLGGLEIRAALAAVRAGQRDSGIPDGQAGLKLSIDGWSGAAMAGLGTPSIAPLSVGVSAMYRRIQVPPFKPEPGSESIEDQAWGIVAQALLPVIPAQNIDDRGNALTLTGEFSMGTGIADMYTGMDGGSRFPLLPNPGGLAPAPVYPQNIDNGLVTFDGNDVLHTINWRAFVAGLQYYLPIGGGRVYLAGIYSRVESDNLQELTPVPHRSLVFTKMEYVDASLGFFVTPALMFGVTLSTVKQTFGDVTADDPVWGPSAPTGTTPGSLAQRGTGGDAVTARNNRGQLSAMYVF